MATAKSTAGPRADAVESKGPVSQSDAVTTAQGLDTKEGREASVQAEDERLKRLNEQNREGHEKNMKKVEEHGEQVAKAADAGPTSGKEWNRNTPRIDKDGTKHGD